MKPSRDYVCPRCDYPLVPVYAVERSKRHVIALTCPEPYCDHMQMLPRERASLYLRHAEENGPLEQRAAN